MRFGAGPVELEAFRQFQYTGWLTPHRVQNDQANMITLSFYLIFLCMIIEDNHGVIKLFLIYSNISENKPFYFSESTLN